MEKTFTKKDVRNIVIGSIVVGFLLGGIITFLLFPKIEAFGIADGDHALADSTLGDLPINIARGFTSDFKHSCLVAGFYPRTDCTIHNYDSLRKYVDSLGPKFFDPIDTKAAPGYQRGVAFYLGRSKKQNYALPMGNQVNCLLKNNYTVVLLPVFYNEKDTIIDCQEMKRVKGANGGKGHWTYRPMNNYPVRVLDTLRSPLDSSLYQDTRFKNTPYATLKLFGDGDDESLLIAYDLGHTHP